MGKTAEKNEELIPKGFLYALGFLVFASLVIVFFSVLTDRPMAGLPAKSELDQELMFELVKMDDGSVSLFDESKRNILNSRDGNSGFISVILTGLEYNRNKTGSSLKSNYVVGLYKYKSGRIAIEDIDTDWTMNVTSFGSKNAKIFVSMFEKKEGEK